MEFNLRRNATQRTKYFESATTEQAAQSTTHPFPEQDDVDYESSGSRIAFIVIGFIISLTSLYVLVSLVIYRVRLSRKIKRNESMRAENRLVRRSTKKKKKSTPSLDNLCLAAAIFSFLNASSDHPILYTIESSNLLCKIMQIFTFIFYAVGIAMVYSFLWARQRSCYKEPSLVTLYNKVSRVLSACILLVFLIMMVVGMILTAVVWEFKTSNVGCVEVTHTITPLAVLFAGSVAMQITLLSLFVYPLKRHSMFQKSMSPSSDKLLVGLVKRSTIITLLCVMTDAITFTIAACLYLYAPFIIVNYMYSVNLLCNVVGIVGSFADWRQRLMPWMPDKKPVFKGMAVSGENVSTSLRQNNSSAV